MREGFLARVNWVSYKIFIGIAVKAMELEMLVEPK
jgi:hypothetical protein